MAETYWGCYCCGAEIPEPQVYCSEACRQEMED
jgi:predicted nucleic acid-binding Zn ribbon protein